MAGNRKTTRKRTAGTTGRKATPGAKVGPQPATGRGGTRKPSCKVPGAKPAAALTLRRLLPRGLVREDWGTMTLAQQRRAGYVLLIVSLVSIAGVGAWVVADSLHGVGHWATRVAIRSISAALVGLALWAVLSRRRAVSRVLIVGLSAFGLFVYEAGSAWRAEQARALADRTLAQIESGTRDLETLTAAELADPYVEAYVIMRDIYWELYLRSDDAMSRYRSYYEDYTAEGAFLDVARLTTKTDLSRSILQIDDLQIRLQHVEAGRPDISDLLLTVDLLDVDPETRAAYADDLRAARDSFVRATAASVAQERNVLREMRQSLEALLDAEGRYRIQGGRLIFERPEDAARFAGESEAG